jgi:hypothetical protein
LRAFDSSIENRYTVTLKSYAKKDTAASTGISKIKTKIHFQRNIGI